MASIKPLNNTVMFQFLDGTSGKQGRFTNTTASGIIVKLGDAEQKGNRWGKVLAAGPKADVKEGDFILIESLMWMEGIQVDGVKMWKTDDTKILLVTQDRSLCEMQ